jgi:hypothetical protein
LIHVKAALTAAAGVTVHTTAKVPVIASNIVPSRSSNSLSLLLVAFLSLLRLRFLDEFTSKQPSYSFWNGIVTKVFRRTGLQNNMEVILTLGFSCTEPKLAAVHAVFTHRERRTSKDAN